MSAMTTKSAPPADRELEAETELAQATGVTSPSGWRLWGLVALLVVIAILLALQFLGGNKGTDVIPGTPVAAPQQNVPVPDAG